MRRPALLLAATALALPLLTSAPSTEAASHVRHYLEADQIGTTGDDVALDVATWSGLVASAGGVDGELAGQTAAGGHDAYVRLVGEDHTVYWTDQLGGPGNDGAQAVAVTGSEVAAGGRTAGGLAAPGLGGDDAWLRLYDIDGNALWTKSLGSAGEDAVLDVAIANHHVYAAGMLDGDAQVWKFKLDGTLVWAEDPTGLEGPYDEDRVPVTSLAVAGDQVFVTEYFDNHYDDPSYLVQALDDTTGAVNWQHGTGPHRPSALTVDGDNLYFMSWTDDYDLVAVPYAVVISYTLAGQHRWTSRPYHEDDYGTYPDYPIALDTAGSSVVAVVNPTWRDVDVLVGLSQTDGSFQWTQRLPAGFEATSAANGSSGFYVGGRTAGALDGTNAGAHDAAVARAVSYQPDARARFQHGADLIGDDIYGLRNQRLVVYVEGTRPRTVVLSAQNDGEVTQRLRITGCKKHDGYAVRYFDLSGENLTQAVTGRGHRTIPVAPAVDLSFLAVVKPLRADSGPTACRLSVASARTGERDLLTLKIKRP